MAMMAAAWGNFTGMIQYVEAKAIIGNKNFIWVFMALAMFGVELLGVALCWREARD
jgi:hypothetical protein